MVYSYFCPSLDNLAVNVTRVSAASSPHFKDKEFPTVPNSKVAALKFKRHTAATCQ